MDDLEREIETTIYDFTLNDMPARRIARRIMTLIAQKEPVAKIRHECEVSETAPDKEPTLWELVKNIEEKQHLENRQLGEARATMLLNFGKEGRAREGIVEECDGLSHMIIKIARFYEDKIKELESH